MYNYIMKKIFPIFLLSISIFIFILNFSLVNASTISNANVSRTSFGGKITQTKSIEIEQKESLGYKCEVPGQTITIRSVNGYSKSYLIPMAVKNKSAKTISVGKWILGLKGSSVPITCTNTTITTIVSLPSIILFGTS